MSRFCTAQDTKEQDCYNESKIMLSLYFPVLNITLVVEVKPTSLIPLIVL